jgi:hypothetical protein
MCWNENVSLNTFLFTSAVLIFIFYNNQYTQYKIEEFKDWKLYLLFFSFTSIQLVEYFLWKSIKEKNKYNNKIFSIIGWIIIRILQPFCLLLLIPDKYLLIKYLSFFVYFILLIIISIYKHFYNPVDFTTLVGKNTHLSWNWINLDNNFEYIIAILYFILYIPLIMKIPIISLIILGFYVFCYIKYYNTLTWGSMWCWISNSLLLYFLIKILFISPYNEYKMLC